MWNLFLQNEKGTKSNMKKILFSAVSLDVGGIEKALVMLLNNLADKYDVTLVLENNSGIFKSEINSKINIV